MPDAPFADAPESHPVSSRSVIKKGHILSFVRESLDYNGEAMQREFVEHPGAVGIIALDEQDRVLTIRQYRHPIRTRDWEVPAGLLDAPGESPLAAAQRELAEEADTAASEWNVLLDLTTSPGSSNEVVRLFLARGLSPVEHDYVRGGEEVDIEVRWVPIEQIALAAAAGEVRNAILISGALAALAARAREWTGLRGAGV